MADPHSTWLVTGGAGYIGAHVTAALQRAGLTVVVLDDLSTGDPRRLTDTELVEGSVLDRTVVAKVLRDHHVTGVVHLAGKKDVAESLARPDHYRRENVGGLSTLLGEIHRAGVGALVFSSSAAVYGTPTSERVSEADPCAPINPYGASKLAGEQLVQLAAAHDRLAYANLRYFNVAGAAGPGMGDHRGTNLIPAVFARLTQGLPPSVYGGGHPTVDGSCVRDFVHVADVASAHVAAALALTRGDVVALTANVGRGHGVSVLQLVEHIREVAGFTEHWADPVIQAARPGDPASVVACADHIHDVLGWSAQHGVTDMVSSAWDSWSSYRLPISA